MTGNLLSLGAVAAGAVVMVGVWWQGPVFRFSNTRVLRAARLQAWVASGSDLHIAAGAVGYRDVEQARADLAALQAGPPAPRRMLVPATILAFTLAGAATIAQGRSAWWIAGYAIACPAFAVFFRRYGRRVEPGARA